MARIAASANQATLARPFGMMTHAASNGPTALPPFPPT